MSKASPLSRKRPGFRNNPRPAGEPGDTDLLPRYKAMVEAIPDLILRIDGNGRYLDAHAGYQVKLAYEPEAFIGRTIGELFAPEFAQTAHRCIRNALDTGETQVWEYPLSIEGESRQYESRIIPSGRHEVIAIIRDVTESRQTQEQLSLSESRLKEAQQMAKVGNWEWDANTEEFWWSEETYRIFGIETEIPPTFDVFIERVHPDDRERVDREVNDARCDGRSDETQYRLMMPDGIVKTVDSRFRSIADETGRITKWIGVVRDVTELTELSMQLAEQNTELAVRDRNKDRFLTTLGHELRNPMGAIKNSLDLISLVPTGAAGEGQRKLALDVIRRQSDQLLSLLDDLLDLERVKHGKFELRLDAVDLVQLAGEVLELYETRADKAGRRISLASPANSVHVCADRARLQQIFENLLDNALQSTEEGDIDVTIRKDSENAEVVVRDTGMGIDPDEAVYIFEPYYQGSRGKSGAGTLGFGLALVKGIVEKHGGTIDVHSDGIGTGAAFTFTIPLATTDCEQPQDVTPAIRPRRHRILVVDDERDNAEVFAAMLEELGQDIRIAYNGADALEIARTQHPHVAFLDLSMPGMDGREVAERLREMFSPAELILVAVTGLAPGSVDADRDDPDFSHYLMKPARLQDVAELLNSIQAPRLRR